MHDTMLDDGCPNDPKDGQWIVCPVCAGEGFKDAAMMEPCERCGTTGSILIEDEF